MLSFVIANLKLPSVTLKATADKSAWHEIKTTDVDNIESFEIVFATVLKTPPVSSFAEILGILLIVIVKLCPSVDITSPKFPAVTVVFVNLRLANVTLPSDATLWFIALKKVAFAAVTPTTRFNSAVVVVTPSNLLSSAAVDVTDVPPILNPALAVTEVKDKLLTSKSPLNFKLEPVMFPLADTLPFILKVSVTSFVLIPIWLLVMLNTPSLLPLYILKGSCFVPTLFIVEQQKVYLLVLVYKQILFHLPNLH